MQSQPDLKQSYFGIILRSALGYGFGFALIYLLYCLIDTLLNFGNTLWQGRSVWGLLYLHPSALAVALGTLLAGNWKNKRQGWGAAAAAFVGYTLFFRISRLAVASLMTSIDYFLLQFVFLMLLGMIVAGGTGLIQHGKKSAGWYALAGGTGFNIGWLIDNDISQYILRQNMVNLSQLVVGSPTYYLYFLLPSLFWGAVIGACIGMAAGAERMKKPVYLPA